MEVEIRSQTIETNQMKKKLSASYVNELITERLVGRTFVLPVFIILTLIDTEALILCQSLKRCSKKEI
jgi:hypothetical protein